MIRNNQFSLFFFFFLFVFCDYVDCILSELDCCLIVDSEGVKHDPLAADTAIVLCQLAKCHSDPFLLRSGSC